ncbi:hypothetical protein [Candidatus Nitrospira allomarina]|uniref:Apea-like HEPN domain-containing protein n=1 Tax=Candidatus Nitrospira allomarina TaxID=3020900 RepID=A0AA96GDD3_9BACT|nr:hypothetical protein [Candidatus Nitrospira allomarina]WNM57890.1 hypothetical protein PP769_18250 [Candidatus Nitrospira allomarina]
MKLKAERVIASPDPRKQKVTPERSPGILAREWLQRGKLAQSPIDAFTDFWRAFNNLYSAHPGIREIERVRAFLMARVPSVAAATILSSHQEQVDYLLSQPVSDMRGNGRNTKTAVAAFRAGGSDQEKLCELFTIIYQVRCNLQHGQKSPTVDRDLRLCECSAPVVAEVVACSV